MNDPVSGILQQWHHVRPDLDCTAMGLVGRLRRVNNLWQKELDNVFKQHALTSTEFDILATLRRSDEPLTPTELYQTLMLSSGAMSTRLERLVQRGLVSRIASDEDRRSCKVTLTAQGKKQIDNALDDHVANMDRLIDGFSAADREQLVTLLNQVLLAQKAT